jgi:hypothetical protein
MRRRNNDKPQEAWMKLALHATEPATHHSAAAQLIDYDLMAAAQLIEHDLEAIALLICYRESSACSNI